MFAASVLSDRGGRVSEDELEKMTGKHMVETTEQGIAGVERGAFTNKGYICVEGLNRICAPTPADTQMSACIFWTKTSAEDISPTWDKVVSKYLIFCISPEERFQFGSIVYNLGLLDTKFCQDNNEVSKEMTATFNAVM